ncbi:MAG: glycosyltransferase family 2 protein [Nitrospirae bacterium]|nr:glycosyltransferase family 2 protein [Nitrospirota bacterium]
MNRQAETPLISVVMPVYREGSSLRSVLDVLVEVLLSLKESFEVILVDDGSPDDTWVVIEQASMQYPVIRAVRLSRNFGKESAICAGLEMASGKAVIVMDGDLQHPPQLIPEMVRLWRESKADVVEAVKDDRGQESFVNRIGAGLFYSVFSRLSGYDLDRASDYKLIDRRVVDAWLTMGERNLFFRGMISWLGFRHLKIPFTVPERAGGQSGWSLFRLIKLAVTAVTSFSSLPLHLITLSGGVFLFFGMILGLQTLFNKLTGKAVSGFATVILLLLIIGSLLMISLGIIGEYIARIYEEVKRRPRYLISEKLERRVSEK